MGDFCPSAKFLQRNSLKINGVYRSAFIHSEVWSRCASLFSYYMLDIRL